MALKRITLCLAACLVLTVPAALAQNASLTGLVMDQSGAVLPGVTVTAINQLTNIKSSAISNETGHYTVMSLKPSVYRLEAELPGFKKYSQANISLEVDQVGRVDIKLEIGQLAETVQVVGEAPLLNTESAAKGSVIYNEEIVDLPLESREFYDLAFLTVGVVPQPEGGQGGFASVNGARQDSMNYVLDGGNNNILRAGDAVVRPSMDSVQEFKVQTSNYSAEYGRRSTAVINVVLRSGTNQYSGSVFHFHRNAAFDARNFFDLDKSKLIRNNFGGNIGGPIIKDKMFFFANYEGMRRRQGLTKLERTLTLAERAGDFSSLLTLAKPIILKDPLTAKAFPNNPNNLIPASRFHPISVKIMDFFPLPNVTRGEFNYVANKVDSDDWNDYVGKIDYNFSNGDTLSGRYLYNDRNTDNPFNGSNFPAFGNGGNENFRMVGLSFTHTFTPRVVTQFSFTFSRKDTNLVSRLHSEDWCSKLGIVGCTTDPQLFGFPRITIRGIGELGEAVGNPIDWTENDFDVNASTSIVTGSHNVRFGGQYIRTQFFELFPNNSRGLFNFLSNWTGDPVADFLTGFLNNTNRRLKATTNYLFATSYSGFVQDDWKITSRLTVNLGLRWDFFSPPVDKFGNWSNFEPALGRIVLSGEEGFPESLVRMKKTNFAPRIGIAWRAGDKTVVRTGIGQFYGLSILNPLRTSLGANPPFTIRENYSRLAKDPLLLTWDSPFPSSRAVTDGVKTPDAYEANPNSANIFQYNLTVEREVAQNTVLEVGYMGSKGTHLGRQYDVNQLFYTEDPPGTWTGAREWPDYNAINYYVFDADSNYHALQTSFRKRVRGMNFRINYSLSKSIDDGSRLSGASEAGVAGVQNARNRDAERSLSDFDRRHAVVVSFLYQLPFKKHLLARDWQINTVAQYYSGTPVSPEIANSNRGIGEATRPDRIGSGKLDNPTPEMWYNLADFPPVPAGSYRFGNTGRNVVTGPDKRTWNISFMRYFKMPHEGHRLQFRFEIYNWPNTVNFKMPEEQVNINTSGAIAEAYEARQMQFALKYTF